MEKFRFFMGLLCIGVFVFLASKVKISTQTEGADYAFNKTWEEVAEEFPALAYLPKFAEKIDVWEAGARGDSRNGMYDPELVTVSVGFKEVKNASARAEEIKNLLEAVGFEEEQHIRDRFLSSYKEDVLGVQYYELYKKVSGGKAKSITVTIEYFEYQYENSHNVYITIDPY